MIGANRACSGVKRKTFCAISALHFRTPKLDKDESKSDYERQKKKVKVLYHLFLFAHQSWIRMKVKVTMNLKGKQVKVIHNLFIFAHQSWIWIERNQWAFTILAMIYWIHKVYFCWSLMPAICFFPHYIMGGCRPSVSKEKRQKPCQQATDSCPFRL